MADRPILFSAPMVRALLAGTKAQTRRVFKGVDEVRPGYFHVFGSGGGIFCDGEPEVKQWAPSYLRIDAGDRLYVRETFSGLWEFEGIPPREWPHPYPLWYWADGNPQEGDWTKPRPGIHMPSWASRITLTVTDVRVERLQDISEEDAVAEGIVPVQHREGGTVRYSGVGAKFGLAQHTAKLAYAHLWDSINGEDAWSENPWVAAYTFAVKMGNIDQLEAA